MCMCVCAGVCLLARGGQGEGDYSAAVMNFVGHIFRSADNLRRSLARFDETIEQQRGRHGGTEGDRALLCKCRQGEKRQAGGGRGEGV